MAIRDDDLSLLSQAIHAIRRMVRDLPSDRTLPLERAALQVGDVLDRLLVETQRLVPAREVLESVAVMEFLARALWVRYPQAEVRAAAPPPGRIAGDADRIARMIAWGVDALIDAPLASLDLTLMPAMSPPHWSLHVRFTAARLRPTPHPERWHDVQRMAEVLGGNAAGGIDADHALLVVALQDGAMALAPGTALLDGWPVWRYGAPPPEALQLALAALGAVIVEDGAPSDHASPGIVIIGPHADNAPAPQPGILRIGWGHAPISNVHLMLTDDETPVSITQRIGMVVRRMVG